MNIRRPRLSDIAIAITGGLAGATLGGALIWAGCRLHERRGQR